MPGFYHPDLPSSPSTSKLPKSAHIQLPVLLLQRSALAPQRLPLATGRIQLPMQRFQLSIFAALGTLHRQWGRGRVGGGWRAGSRLADSHEISTGA